MKFLDKSKYSILQLHRNVDERKLVIVLLCNWSLCNSLLDLNVWKSTEVSLFPDISKCVSQLLYQNVAVCTTAVLFPHKARHSSSVLCINVFGSIELISFSDISKWFGLLLFRNVCEWISVILFPFKTTHFNSVLCINVSGCLNWFLFLTYLRPIAFCCLEILREGRQLHRCLTSKKVIFSRSD